MKKSLLFSVVLLLSVALFTSCLKDDDDNNNTNQGLTKEQIHNCYLQMAGEHSGKMLYLKKENSGAREADSVDITWTVVSDSVITIHDVPAEALASTAESEPIKTAIIETMGKVDMKVYYLPYKTSPITFTDYPNPLQANIFYNNATHTVTFGFVINTYSWGSFENNKMRMQLVLDGIYLDTSTYSYLTTQAPLVIEER